MNILQSEKELCTALDDAEQLIRDCVEEKITFDVFLEKYDCFYMRYALDGHESDETELALLEKYSAKIAVHKAICDEIEAKITADEFMTRPEVIEAGFIGHAEGFVRLKNLAHDHRVDSPLP